MAGDVNLLYVLPNALAFLTLLSAMISVTVSYCLDVQGIGGLSFLPQQATTTPPQLAGCMVAGFCVLVLLWPVTRCIFADLLGVPYYQMAAIESTFIAATFQVGIGIILFLSSRTIPEQ